MNRSRGWPSQLRSPLVQLVLILGLPALTYLFFAGRAPSSARGRGSSHGSSSSSRSCPAAGHGAMSYPESYSLWASPKGTMFEHLKKEMGHLAHKYGGPAFNPHVTVLGDIMRPKEEVLAIAQELAKQAPKYRINFQNVAAGTFFYQCVFLLAGKDEGTMATAALARKLYGMTTGPYMPHLSLLYADMSDEQKAKVVEVEVARLYGEGSGYDTLLTETGYEVGTIQVWYTPTDDRSLGSWCMVGEYELQG